MNMWISDADIARLGALNPGLVATLLHGDGHEDTLQALSNVELPMATDDFGLHLIFDLHDVDPRRIKDQELIAAFGPSLAGAIGMKTYGAPVVVYFAEHNPIAAGNTWQQLITTSDFTGHFSDLKARAYLSVFSCKRFAPVAVMNLARTYFGHDDHPATVAQWVLWVRP